VRDIAVDEAIKRDRTAWPALREEILHWIGSEGRKAFG
jgi:hypothetical protein